MTSVQQQSAALFFFAVATRVAFHFITGFTADDAYITFRFAENIAAAKGFVYNEGQPVFGSSTPLFTFLLSLLVSLGARIQIGALVLSLAASGMTAVIIYRLASYLRYGRFAWLPAGLYILWPRSLLTDVCGMETALFTLFIISAFYFQYRRLHVYALALATLATLTRYEGMLLLGPLLLVCCYREREMMLKYMAIPLSLLLPWAVFSYVYFGSVIPNSVGAKLALYGRIEQLTGPEKLVYLMGWHNALTWVLTALVIWGGWWLNKKQNYGRLAAMWMLGMIAFFTLGRTHVFSWYIVPIYPLYLLYAAAGLIAMIESLKLSSNVSSRVKTYAAVPLLLLLLYGDKVKAEYYREYQQILDEVHKSIGQYLNAHANEDDLIASEDIGYIGYYSGGKILDRDGLISPEVIPYNESGRYHDLIKDFRPDWVIAGKGSLTAGFIGDSVFVSQYRQARAFESATGVIYYLFARRSPVDSVLVKDKTTL